MNRRTKMVAAAFALMCMAGGNSYAVSDKQLETENAAVKVAREVQRGGYQIMTAPELKAWKDQKKDMLLVDATSETDRFRQSHIPGAAQFEFPAEELAIMDDKKKEAFEKLLGPDKDRVIVFYCGYTECGRSHNGALWAVRLGYRHVFRQPGGIAAWKDAGFADEGVK